MVSHWRGIVVLLTGRPDDGDLDSAKTCSLSANVSDKEIISSVGLSVTQPSLIYIHSGIDTFKVTNCSLRFSGKMKHEGYCRRLTRKALTLTDLVGYLISR
jgi:hypothetical protein